MLVKIAVCESKLNPYARSLDYGGLYQFSTNTWINTRRTMNLDQNPDLRFNPEESIKTAAFKISTGGINAWQNCIK
jgi:soluble lytic murein transglycosylase-like protein